MDKNFTSGASSVTVQYSVTGNCQNKVSFEKDSDFIGVFNFGKSAGSEDILKEMELDMSSLVIKIKDSI